MEIKRTTEISVETTRRFVVRQPESSAAVFCPHCAEPMLEAEQLAAFFGVSQRRIFQIVETGAAHFREVETGAALICLASLAAALRGAEETTFGGKTPNQFRGETK